MPSEVLICIGDERELLAIAAIENCPELKIARRCVDLIEVASSALAGIGQLALIVIDDQELTPEMALLLLENGVTPVIWGERTHPTRGVVCVGGKRIEDVIEALLAAAHKTDGPAESENPVAPIPEAAPKLAPSRRQKTVKIETPILVADEVAETEKPSRRIRKSWFGGKKKKLIDAELMALGEENKAQVIAVTGAHGAPGRSTIALELARMFALGRETVLIDADNYAPALLELSGTEPPHPDILDLLDAGSKDLAGCGLGPNLRLIAGLSGAHRWRELSADAVIALASRLREAGITVVIDLAAYIPQTSALTFGADRDALTREIVAWADQVVYVGRGDTVGLVRMLRMLDFPSLAQALPHLVVNQVQVGAGSSLRSVRDILSRAGYPQVEIMRFDPAVIRSVLYRRSWQESDANTPALYRLAVTLTNG